MNIGDSSDFGELTLHRATEADHNAIVEFLMTDFLFNEPLNKAIDLQYSDAVSLFKELTRMGIASSLSYVLKTPSGEIAAVRLANILDRPEKENLGACEGSNDNNNDACHAPPANDKASKITSILSEMENKMWVLINPRLKRLLNWLVISVDRRHTRRGLARKLLLYRLDEAELMGCEALVTEASAFNSQQLFRKLGYEIIHEIRHDEWLDESGRQIFQCEDGTERIELVFKSF